MATFNTNTTMKNKINIITACVAALAFCAPVVASAASKKAPAAAASASPAASAAASPAAKAAKMERSIPFKGMITSADMKAKTFTIAGKEKSRVFKITDKTVLMKNGAAATMKDVVANEEARGSYWKEADGSLEARSVKLGPMTDAEKAAASKHSKKKAKGAPSADASQEASPSATPKP